MWRRRGERLTRVFVSSSGSNLTFAEWECVGVIRCRAPIGKECPVPVFGGASVSLRASAWSLTVLQQ